jgi:hypothetical protein
MIWRKIRMLPYRVVRYTEEEGRVVLWVVSRVSCPDTSITSVRSLDNVSWNMCIPYKAGWTLYNLTKNWHLQNGGIQLEQFLYILYSHLYQILIRDQMNELVYNSRSDTCIRGSDIYKLPQLFSGFIQTSSFAWCHKIIIWTEDGLRIKNLYSN